MNHAVESTEMQTGEEQCSFRKNRSCSDGNLFIKQMCEHMKQQDSKSNFQLASQRYLHIITISNRELKKKTKKTVEEKKLQTFMVVLAEPI